jgi:hypothetical protein
MRAFGFAFELVRDGIVDIVSRPNRASNRPELAPKCVFRETGTDLFLVLSRHSIPNLDEA